ncbi:MAG TPA: histidine kinase dimerization/phospho-acceptor domain-containing protein, partial [Puia sp.]|nr:histidine kinase dimerization/phospho-acceptor domain-containing protein [Puia sp.]
MLSLPAKITSLACLLLFHLAEIRPATVLAGACVCLAAASVLFARVRINRLLARTRALEQQVEHRTRQVEEALHTKDLFLTNMSHEIRTPMNGLLGMASLLSQTPLSKEQTGYVESIRSCGDTLLTVINNILDFSAMETGKITLDEKVTDLRSLVSEVLETFAGRAEKAGIGLHHELSAEVPARVITDHGRLRQILLNLVGNAVRFTAQGQVTVRVVRADARDLPTKGEQIGLAFEVVDSGCGIEKDHLAQWQEFFCRADPASRPLAGTGLGLILADRLVH